MMKYSIRYSGIAARASVVLRHDCALVAGDHHRTGSRFLRDMQPKARLLRTTHDIPCDGQQMLRGLLCLSVVRVRQAGSGIYDGPLVTMLHVPVDGTATPESTGSGWNLSSQQKKNTGYDLLMFLFFFVKSGFHRSLR